jgi:hypothetical protein
MATAIARAIRGLKATAAMRARSSSVLASVQAAVAGLPPAAEPVLH